MPRSLKTSIVAGAAMAALALAAAPAVAADIFSGANLVVSTQYYPGTPGNASGALPTLDVGSTLPGCAKANATSAANCASHAFTSIATGAYPYVFNNNTVDGSFGVTVPYTLETLKTVGATSATVQNLIPVPSSDFVGSFSSKSEGALNLSTNGKEITFVGYSSTPGQLDISNSNTPGAIDPTNETYAAATSRTIATVNAAGQFTFTPTNAYSGNNGRAAILDNTTGNYYLVGNAGNGTKNPETSTIANTTGVQLISPNGSNTKIGNFSVTQYGDPADKYDKDDNYRGETVFNNTLYVTKGSGGNGIDTVYQVGTAGALPTAANGVSTPITVLPGFPTTFPTPSGVGFYPFGIWFANATTLYVADEGDGVAADAGNDPNAGLEKWSLVNGVWKLDYVLQNGLGLGMAYTVAGYPTGTNSVTGLSWAIETDGLRNITGKVNADGTVTIYAITSTISGSGDQGADPNELVAINDALSATTLPTTEDFSVLQRAEDGQVLRGVSLAPAPEPTTWAMMLVGVGALGMVLRGSRRRISLAA